MKGGAVHAGLLSVVQRFLGRVLVGSSLAICVLGCSGNVEVEAPKPVARLLPAAYTDTALAFPRLRFADGSLSLNDKCPVRKVKLNPRLAPLFVNGRPIGFC
jgi:hypothetical protein